MINLLLKNIKQTEILSDKLFKIIQPGYIVALNGDLGSGKTTFANCLLKQYIKNFSIFPSPTFSVINKYNFNNTDILHIDLYKITQPQVLLAYNLKEEIEDSYLSLIEWYNKFPSKFIGDYNISINFSIENGYRKVLILFKDPKDLDLIKQEYISEIQQ